MQSYRVYTPDAQFPDGWMHIAVVVARDWQDAVAIARRFPGLSYAILRAVAA